MEVVGIHTLDQVKQNEEIYVLDLMRASVLMVLGANLIIAVESVVNMDMVRSTADVHSTEMTGIMIDLTEKEIKGESIIMDGGRQCTDNQI